MTVRSTCLAAAALPLALACLAPRAHAVSVTEVPLVTNDVVYNPHDGFLYASVPGTALTAPNCVVRIDPATGAIGPSVAVGSEPHDLALSDDGVTLYVGLDGAGAIRRVDLSNMSANLQFTLGNDPYLGTLYAEDIEVLPGSPGSVAVSLRNQGFSPRHMGVAVFDGAVVRPTRTSTHTGSNVIAFGPSASRLYGYNNETTEFGFRRMNITASGVTVLDVTGNLITGFSSDIEFFGGRIYATTGQVVDPEARALVGTFSFPDYAYGRAVAPTVGRVYFATGDFGYSTPVRLSIFDPATFVAIDRYALPGVTGTPNTLHATGDQRLVLRTDGGAHLYVLDRVNEPPSCELALSISHSPAIPTVGNYLSVLLGVANHSAVAADQVTVRAQVPGGLGYQYATSSRGSCYDSLGTVVCNLGTLAARDSATATLVFVPQAEGTYPVQAAVASATYDTIPANNQASLDIHVRAAGYDRADLYARFSSPPETVLVEGRPMHMRLEVGNRGPADATGASFQFYAYGDSIQATDVSAPGIQCSASPQAGCWVGDLPSGSTIPIDVTLLALKPGWATLIFAVNANEQDANYNDNGVVEYVVVLPSVEHMLSVLMQQVGLLGLHYGQEKGLVDPLEQGIAAAAAGDSSGCCTDLAQFQQRLDQRAGRALTLAQAYQLSYSAAMIQNVLGCGAREGDGDLRRMPGPDGAVAPTDAPTPLPSQLEWTVVLKAGEPELRLALPAQSHARVEIVDVQGRVAGVAFDGDLPAGFHTLPASGGSRGDGALAPGVYFYRLAALGQRRVVKLALVR